LKKKSWRVVLSIAIMILIGIYPILDSVPFRSATSDNSMSVGGNASTTTSATSVGISEPFLGNPSVYGDIIAFSSPYLENNLLMYYNMSTGVLTNTTIYAFFPSIYQNKIAYIVPSSPGIIDLYDVSTGQVAYIKTPSEGFNILDFIVWGYYAPSRVLSLGDRLLAYYAFNGNGTWVLDMSSGVWTGLGGGGGVSVSGDIVAYRWGNKIWYYNATSHQTTETPVYGGCPSISGNIITSSPYPYIWNVTATIKYYNITSGTVTDTGLVGYEYDATVNGNIIVFGTNETLANTDLNADGDLLDEVIRAYDVSNGAVINTSEVYDGFSPPSSYGDVIVFVAPGDIVRFVRFVSFVPNDLTILRLVPIQVIWENETSPDGEAKALIKKKKTVVYVEVFSTFPSRVWAGIRVIYDFGSQTYDEPGPTKNWTVPIDPGENGYYLPGGPALLKSGDAKYKLAWMPPDGGSWFYWTATGTDSNIRAIVDPNNAVSARSEFVTNKLIVETKPLRIFLIPLYFPILGETSFKPNDNWLKNETEFMLATYPVADIGPNSLKWTNAHAPYAAPNRWGEPPKDDLDKAQEWLRANLARDLWAVLSKNYDRVVVCIQEGEAALRIFGPVAPNGRRVVGVAPGMYNDPNGNSKMDRRFFVFIRYVSPTFPGNSTVAHEIGHTYYLLHPHDFGPNQNVSQIFDVSKRDYDRPANTFMSYNQTLPYWIDKGRFDGDEKTEASYTINGVLWKTHYWNLLSQFDVNSPKDPEVISLSGMAFENGTLIADRSWFRMAEGIPNLESGDSGNYSIVLLDRNSQILNQMGFNISFTFLTETLDGLAVAHVDPVGFDFVIPFVNGTGRIEIRNATGDVLITKNVSENAPTVNVTYPNGGEVLEPSVNQTITWNATDIDGDQLTYDVLYSSDGGQNWAPLATDVSDAYYTWNVSQFSSTDTYLVRVVANDGVNIGEDVSDGNFTILNRDVAITNVVLSKTVIGRGKLVSFNVTVINNGNLTENFGVTLTADPNTTMIGDEITIGNETIPFLISGGSTVANFILNTTGFAYGNYTVSAYAWPVLGESNTADNNLMGGTIYVGIPGDVNGDGAVNILDSILQGLAFLAKPGDSNWNPNADVNCDNVVNVLDSIVNGLHFLQHYP